MLLWAHAYCHELRATSPTRSSINRDVQYPARIGCYPDFWIRPGFYYPARILNNTQPGPARIKMLPGLVFITRPGFKKKCVFLFFADPAGLKKLKKSCFSTLVCPCGAQKIWKIVFFHFCLSLRGSKYLKNYFLFCLSMRGSKNLKICVFLIIRVPAGLKKRQKLIFFGEY